MDIRFLFAREGMTVSGVAKAAGVPASTASRWKRGRRATWHAITKLHSAGLILDEDLRSAGLALPPTAAASSGSAA